MTREEVIDGLKVVRTIHNGNYAPQIDEAIKSLEAWDKVKEGVDKLTVFHTTSQGSELLSKNAVIRLINKHLGE